MVKRAGQSTALAAYPVESGRSYGSGDRVHTVRVKLMQWDYSTEREVEIGGNTLGFSILDAAIDSIAEEIANEVEAGRHLVMTNPKGDKLKLDVSGLLGPADNDEIDEEMIKELVVCAEIIAVRPEKVEQPAKKGRKARK